MIPQSNAALSKNATSATMAADQATQSANTGMGTHAAAASAHETAQWKNKDAGNITAANRHGAAASIHREKAQPEYAAKSFAQSLARHADTLSKKADMATAAGDAPANGDEYGDKSIRDPRSSKELHEAASEAHDKAAQAHKLAGMKAEQKYHEGKSVEHDEKADA